MAQEHTVLIDREYLLFPISNAAPVAQLRLTHDGDVLRAFKAQLGLPADWWAHLDVSAWPGARLVVSIEAEAEPSSVGPVEAALAAIRTSTDIWSPETLYREPLRPLFHFSTRRGWLNDPNGLVFHAGRYHMFFQHNPFGIRWGTMHWGHAVSGDLVHWEEQPIALYPRAERDEPYSGSGVVDQQNTSGWGEDSEPPMVLAFSSTGRGECIAYSTDDGRTWTEFERNPVVRHKGRDPRLLWHEPTGRWVMVVYSARPSADPASPAREGLAFYTSADLKVWREESWIEGYFECPDLFALPVDGDPADMLWVLSCSSGYYTLGAFDGSRFLPQSPRLPGPAGGGLTIEGEGTRSFLAPMVYAGQTFSNHPHGERVQLAWVVCDTGDGSFSQMMTFPCVLSLRATADGVRLCREPVDAIRTLRVKTHDLPPSQLAGDGLLTDLVGEAWDLEIEIRLGTSSPVVLSIAGDEYIYRAPSQILIGPNGAMSIPLTEGRLRLRVLVDRTTVEVFGDRGQAYGVFMRSNPGGEAALSLSTWKRRAEDIAVEVLRAHVLRSSWT